MNTKLKIALALTATTTLAALTHADTFQYEWSLDNTLSNSENFSLAGVVVSDLSILNATFTGASSAITLDTNGLDLVRDGDLGGNGASAWGFNNTGSASEPTFLSFTITNNTDESLTLDTTEIKLGSLSGGLITARVFENSASNQVGAFGNMVNISTTYSSSISSTILSGSSSTYFLDFNSGSTTSAHELDFIRITGTGTPTVIPEPKAYALMIGLCMAALVARRKSKAEKI